MQLLSRILLVMLRMMACALVLGLAIVLTQDLQVFPGYKPSFLKTRDLEARRLPKGVESIFINTPDKKSIEVWRLGVEVEETPYVALLFHGNADTVGSFYPFQLWFKDLGITSYSFDYRGFGESSGWPNERGIYIDSDSVWEYLLEREGVSPAQVIVLGFSVGGAPAARIASLHNPRLLILLAAFASIDEMINYRRVLRPLRPFSWNKLPTVEFVASLKDTPLILLHGGRDNIVPIGQADILEEAYINRAWKGNGAAGQTTFTRLDSPLAGHNDLFLREREQLAKMLLEELGITGSDTQDLPATP